jgi:Transposase, Mutator family
MGAEADALCRAALGERSPERVNRRNGYRKRRLDTRVAPWSWPSQAAGWQLLPGLAAGAAPASRACPGGGGGRVLRAWVSTRRVEGLVQTLGVQGMSKSQVSEPAKSLDTEVAAFRSRPLDADPYPYVWVDALAVKCREAGRIVNVAAVIATGVNASGYREILGVDVLTSEDGAGWTGFLRDLVARGLAGVQLVISDATGAWSRRSPRAARPELAAVPDPFHAQPAVPGAQVRPGSGRHAGPHGVRPATGGRGVRGRRLGSPGPAWAPPPREVSQHDRRPADPATSTLSDRLAELGPQWPARPDRPKPAPRPRTSGWQPRGARLHAQVHGSPHGCGTFGTAAAMAL